MLFNTHSSLAGKHAWLSASSPAWLNYDEDKFDRVFLSSMAAARGTEIHDLASRLIRLGVNLPETQETLNMYVNDAIGFKMTPEQILFYSDNAFGTADAISFRRNKLRIHDLKTGVTDAKPAQLIVYAALFCLEYRYKPLEIDYDLRIYQNNEVQVVDFDPIDVVHAADKLVVFDRRLDMLKMEVPR